jgi:hypothetical protein
VLGCVGDMISILSHNGWGVLGCSLVCGSGLIIMKLALE